MDEIRNLFINSANLLSWINSIDATETTSGHVILGYEARAVQKEEQTEGPNVFIWPENYLTQNVFSAKTYIDTFDIVAEIVWFKSHFNSDDFIEELNFVCKMIDEAKDKGITLSSVHRGEVFQVESRDIVLENPNDRDERRSEIRFSIRTGTGQ